MDYEFGTLYMLLAEFTGWRALSIVFSPTGLYRRVHSFSLVYSMHVPFPV